MLTGDLLYAARAAQRSRGVSAAVVLTLALGIGAATALFSVMYGVLYRPLPYRDADRLVTIRMEGALEGSARPVRSLFPLEALDDLLGRTRAFARLALHATETATLSYAGFSEQVTAAAVSPGFFETTGGELASGRWLVDADSTRPVAVISERLEDRLFGRGNALSRTVRLGSRSLEIVGVAGRTFQLPATATDVWVPAADVDCCRFAGIGRLQQGVTPAGAAADVTDALRGLRERSPRVYGDGQAVVVPLRNELVGDVRPALRVLMAAVALVLAVACVNAVTLLMARNASRARDTAVRLALGASRARLALASLAEAALLASAAGVLGTILAWSVIKALVAFDPGVVPGLDPQVVRLDRPALLFTLVIVAVAVAIVGLLPAAGMRQTAGTLAPGAATLSAGPGRRRLHDVLVVLQLAVSVMLLVGAALLGRSLVRLTTHDLGVRPDGVATAAINLTFERKLTDAQQLGRIEPLLERLRALPGVVSAGAGASLPPSTSTLRLTLRRSGDTVDYQAAAVPATPGYFEALGVRLLEGRLFTEDDTASARQVMIMTAATARRFFGDNPIGRSMTLPLLRDGKATNAEMMLIGVIANVKYSGLDAAADDVVYRPLLQQPWPQLFLVARTHGDPRALTRMLRPEIAAIDPAIAVSSVTTLDGIIAAEAARPRLHSHVMSAFAALTTAIAAAGLYGLVAHATARRTKELGIRMALGARSSDLFRLVFASGGRLLAAGLVAGIGASLATARLLRGLLYGIDPGDALSFGAAMALLAVVAAAAIAVPALKASRVDPTVALRTE